LNKSYKIYNLPQSDKLYSRNFSNAGAFSKINLTSELTHISHTSTNKVFNNG